MAFLRECVGRWEIMLEECLQYDQWGQVVEAQDKYRRWLEDVSDASKGSEAGDLAPAQLRQVRRLLTTLQLRMENLRFYSQGGLSLAPAAAADRAPGIDYQTISQIRDRFRAHLLEGEAWPIPIDAHALESGSEGNGSDQGDAFHDNKGTLQGPPRARGRYLKITIHSIGLKDALTYLDPFITVSVRNGPGDAGRVEEEQDTPQPTMRRDDTKVHFMTSVFVQTRLSSLVQQKANIFFEFKHFKPKKSKVSVRCWSMMGWDELDDERKLEGTKDLEIYAKPADFSARKFHKHSVKPLYLTVTCTVLENHS